MKKSPSWPGITPMKNVGMAKYMKNRVPGIDVPEAVIKRIGGVPKEKQAEEGITLASSRSRN